MYGLVNRALEHLIVSQHGEQTWAAVKEKAGVQVEVFVSNESYDDAITYQLVAAASGILHMGIEDLLILFGQHWILMAQESYGPMFKSQGTSLRDFLTNLPNFHARVAMIYPNLRPPEFLCSDVTEKSMHLHYRTHRPGLTSFVIGLVQGLGRLFGTKVSCVPIERKSEGAVHDVFLIQWGEGA
jgi:Haem-NO-binding